MDLMMQGPQERPTESDPHRVDGRQPSESTGADTAGGGNGAGRSRKKGRTIWLVALGVWLVGGRRRLAVVAQLTGGTAGRDCLRQRQDRGR